MMYYLFIQHSNILCECMYSPTRTMKSLSHQRPIYSIKLRKFEKFYLQIENLSIRKNEINTDFPCMSSLHILYHDENTHWSYFAFYHPNCNCWFISFFDQKGSERERKCWIKEFPTWFTMSFEFLFNIRLGPPLLQSPFLEALNPFWRI